MLMTYQSYYHDRVADKIPIMAYYMLSRTAVKTLNCNRQVSFRIENRSIKLLALLDQTSKES